jgi:hypothetical protein
MPTVKKTTAPKAVAKKKAPAKKKLAPKKAAPKAVAPKPPAPIKTFNPVAVYLLTNAAEHTLWFSNEEMYEAAILCIKNAPTKPTGARRNPTYTLKHDAGSVQFARVVRYSVKS